MCAHHLTTMIVFSVILTWIQTVMNPVRRHQSFHLFQVIAMATTTAWKTKPKQTLYNQVQLHLHLIKNKVNTEWHGRQCRNSRICLRKICWVQFLKLNLWQHWQQRHLCKIKKKNKKDWWAALFAFHYILLNRSRNMLIIAQCGY